MPAKVKHSAITSQSDLHEPKYHTGSHKFGGSDPIVIEDSHTNELSTKKVLQPNAGNKGVWKDDLTCDTVTTDTTIEATTTVTAGTGITATTGNIVASTGNISSTVGSVAAATTVTGGTGVTATTGGVTATAGDITATANNIVATAGNITTTAGNITSAGTITAGTGIGVTTGTINITDGNVYINNNATGFLSLGNPVVSDGAYKLRLSATGDAMPFWEARVGGAWVGRPQYTAVHKSFAFETDNIGVSNWYYLYADNNGVYDTYSTYITITGATTLGSTLNYSGSPYTYAYKGPHLLAPFDSYMTVTATLKRASGGNIPKLFFVTIDLDNDGDMQIRQIIDTNTVGFPDTDFHVHKGYEGLESDPTNTVELAKTKVSRGDIVWPLLKNVNTGGLANNIRGLIDVGFTPCY